MEDPINVVKMLEITKSFPGVVALEGVDFELRKGEIHGLVGERASNSQTKVPLSWMVSRYRRDRLNIPRNLASARYIKRLIFVPIFLLLRTSCWDVNLADSEVFTGKR
jgi:ABC-type phosphonate transport system ATPase subunit